MGVSNLRVYLFSSFYSLKLELVGMIDQWLMQTECETLKLPKLSQLNVGIANKNVFVSQLLRILVPDT